MNAALQEFDTDWELSYWETMRDLEAFQSVCWCVLLRTLRDLYTYSDCSKASRKKIYETSFNWIFQLSSGDENQPMSFVWVCGILGLDHNKVAEKTWDLRSDGFAELKKILVAMREPDCELQQ